MIPAEPMGFTGKEADEEVGLVYFGERYLMPHLGRWASADPLHTHANGGGEFGNSYHYISGNLLQGRDPIGLEEGATEEDMGNASIIGDPPGHPLLRRVESYASRFSGILPTRWMRDVEASTIITVGTGNDRYLPWINVLVLTEETIEDSPVFTITHEYAHAHLEHLADRNPDGPVAHLYRSLINAHSGTRSVKGTPVEDPKRATTELVANFVGSTAKAFTDFADGLRLVLAQLENGTASVEKTQTRVGSLIQSLDHALGRAADSVGYIEIESRQEETTVRLTADQRKVLEQVFFDGSVARLRERAATDAQAALDAQIEATQANADE